MSCYRMGLGGEHPNILPEQIRRRVDNLKIGAGLWKTAEIRFYKIGINPRFAERPITGNDTVDTVVNMAADVVNIGMLLLGASAIRAAIT